MSGPKIVRTITRAERIEQARVQIAMINEAIKRWRFEVASTDDDAAARERSFLSEESRVEKLLAADRFEEIAPRANLIVASVNDDIDRMRDEQYVRLARVLEQERSTRFTAKALLDRSRKAGVAIPEESREVLESLARGETKGAEHVSNIAAFVYDEIARKEHGVSPNAAHELARALGSTAGPTSAAGLLREAEENIRDPRVPLADKQIAELARLGDREAAATLGSRLEKLVSEDPGRDPARVSLALDALGAELAGMVRLARRLAELRRALSREIAAAEATNDVEACRQKILEAEVEIDRRQPDRAEKQITKLREAREACIRARATNSRRAAILLGLKELGYEVKEGMSTIWADRKRLVIAHPSQQGVALELEGNAESGRLQARMVAVQGAIRGPDSDREVEERWCGELKNLQDSLARAGGAVFIERSTPAGEYPLKVVTLEQRSEPARAHEAPAPARQKLRQQPDPRRP